MGVSLEDMDAVFGEGATEFIYLVSLSLTDTPNLDELQELCENQWPERTSLVGSTRSRRSATHRFPSPSFLRVVREWFSGVVGRSRVKSAYEPIRGDE